MATTKRSFVLPAELYNTICDCAAENYLSPSRMAVLLLQKGSKVYLREKKAGVFTPINNYTEMACNGDANSEG